MNFIDTHSHVYSDDFNGDQDAMIARAIDQRVDSILMPAIDAGTHAAMLDLESRYPDVCLSMMGLHPCSVKDDYQRELDIAQQHLENRRFIAIGETGLDFYWDLTFKDQQYIAFRQQVAWAGQYDIPVVIHSRNSTDECIEVISGMQDGSLKGLFHCFSGTVEQARQIMDLGFYLGIGGVLTFKNSGLDKVLQALDLQRVVLETDAPYLAPVPFRGKRNEPAYLVHIAQKLADLKEISIEQIAETTTANAQNLFGLQPKNYSAS